MLGLQPDSKTNFSDFMAEVRILLLNICIVRYIFMCIYVIFPCVCVCVCMHTYIFIYECVVFPCVSERERECVCACECVRVCACTHLIVAIHALL